MVSKKDRIRIKTRIKEIEDGMKGGQIPLVSGVMQIKKLNYVLKKKKLKEVI